MSSALPIFNSTTEVRPLSKAPYPQLPPGRRSNGCPLLRVCVHGRSGFQCSSKKEEDCRAVGSDVPCRFAVSGHWSDRSSKESVATRALPQKAWGQGQATQLKSLWGNTDLRTVIITKKASKRVVVLDLVRELGLCSAGKLLTSDRHPVFQSLPKDDVTDSITCP
ncbi:hypothetical protein DPX16_14632 [Anabarilius grahami]|uniref:Uncharacterized protein n=1 Tax=Anabarilius grahami TaxID=495550 RepID=A0A3N0YYF2_ANAGA|nr:hypothetical protein DPX16_14632 [Anabarilius grahami]